MHKNIEIKTHSKSGSFIAIALMLVAVVITASMACSSDPDTVVQTVVVEKEVPVRGETVIQTVVVEKVVEVPVEVEKIVEKEVVVQGEVVVQTVVVEQEVVKEVEVDREVTVVVEREVEVEREVQVVVQAERAATAAPPTLPGASGQPSQPGGTAFENTTRSDFALTSEDDTSTFSLDTDRTSFQLALNWARSGYEVDPASVRAEEWINAFNYGYEFPRHDDSFNIRTDVIPHPLDSDLHLARVAFQAPDVVVELPLNVTLVLDNSGSMWDGNRVEIAREAAETIRGSLDRDDRMSVVHFAREVKRDLTVRNENPDSSALIDSIQAIHPSGSTNVQAGLDLGVRIADDMRRNRPDAYNYVILMSDGVANVDATNPFAILESASDNNPDNPLRLITIGVGINNYNDVLLEQLAQHGNGWYRYLSEPDEGRRLFSRENWLALSVPFADQTRAQVVWDENLVRSWRMIGYENRVTSDESFTRAEKKFAELPAGSATTVFFELELVDPYVLGNSDHPLGEVEVRWVTPRTGDDNRQHQEIDAELAPSDAAIEFGSVVALVADQYSGLHEYGGEHPGSIHQDLSDLANMLQGVGSPMAGTTAYHDFDFVLNWLVDNVEPAASTGYSR